ncbi:cysteine desulfurase [Candidatus Peregrinibacteria bacterium]|jgi:cysteine desulfurase|nr:cysteine desulfurase [Candidatus Peregrinibacteria bacterium]
MKRIYLDYAATTPVDPQVLEVMKPYFTENFANPSSLHTSGQEAKKDVDQARKKVAGVLGASSTEVVFTGSGTESNNLAIFGIAANAPAGAHFITSAIEHESVLEPFKELEKRGFRVTYLMPEKSGIISVDDLKNALTDDTVFVSVMYANNEIGTIQPITEIGEMLRAQKITKNTPIFHTDACQAAGALPLDVNELGVDLLTLNGGKIYGPKGVGALYVRSGIEIKPQIYGGGHERGLRSGTENVPGIIGLAATLQLVQARRDQESSRLITLRDQLLTGLQKRVPDLILNGDLEQRLPNNLNLVVTGVEGEILLLRLDMEGIDASAGSACTAGHTEPSHVLLALGRSKQEAYQSVRLSLGHLTTAAEIDRVLEIFPKVVAEIRKESGTY